MSILNKPGETIDPSTVSPWPTILRYGLIGGLVLVVYALLGNLLGFTKPSAGFVTLILSGMVVVILLYAGVMIAAVRNHQANELGGYISFGRAMMVAFMVGLIMAIIGILFNNVYANVIEPDFVTTLLDEAEAMYEEMNMSAEQIQASLAQLEGQYTLNGQIIGLGMGSVFGAIMSLIIAAVMKKNPPENA